MKKTVCDICETEIGAGDPKWPEKNDITFAICIKTEKNSIPFYEPIDICMKCMEEFGRFVNSRKT